jgi:hypothetical protein
MTISTRIEYVVHASIELPDGTKHQLRHVFDTLTKADDVAAWFKRQGCGYANITQVQISETFTPIDV